MIRFPASLLVVLLCAVSLRAEMKIENVQAAYGPIWPERTPLVYYPSNDAVFFRFLITGADVSDGGDVDAEIVTELRDAEGKVLRHQEAPWKLGADYGGGAVVGFAGMALHDAYPPGTYTLSVIVKDKHTSAVAQFERQLTFKGDDWAIVQAQFFSDPEYKQPTTLGGVTGEWKRYLLKVVGFDRGRVDFAVKAQVLDRKGVPVARPHEWSANLADPAALTASGTLDIRGQLGTFTRPGDFLLRITVTDRARNKAATVEMPLSVTLP
jgi:hypothetical protein